jgi:hypothetical protein
MRRLIDRRGRERGAVAVIVAFVVGSLALTGVAALTVDAGSLYAERRVVQNAADAASLELAQACARGDVARCSPSASDLTTLADLNSPDGLTDIDSVCGSTAPFTPCLEPLVPTLSDCTSPAPLPAGANWVEVRTKTRSTSANHPSVVPKLFANALDPSYAGTGMSACARAGWGSVGTSTNAFPLVLGVCGWDQATVGGTHFATAPSPQYRPAPNQNANGTGTSSLPSASLVPADTLTAITVHTSSGTNGVYKYDTQQAGKYYPGGFGWAQTTGSGCSADFTDTGNVTGSNGAAAPSGCKGGGIAPYVGTVVLVPIFKEVVGSTYVIDGLASFYLAGYANVPAGGPKSMDGYQSSLFPVCNEGSSTTCLYGWFTAPLVKVGSISGSGSTPRGPVVVQVLG